MARTASYDRDAALDAAMVLFWTKGYHATSLKDLEATLSMKPGSIYAAFQSKEALFRATLDRYAKRMTSELEALISSSASPLSAMQAHLRGLADLAPCDRPSTACMLVKSLLEVPQESELRAFITGHLDRVEQVIGAALVEARDKGELPKDCDTGRLARRVQTYIFGLKVQAQRETDPERMRDLCSDLAEEIGRMTVA
ncbi:TetR/AcrR family transcriptional regulator [Salipiger mucosus]|uniref:Transcriptional regulator, TetR family n=1 Tax=Salipiger mucosus DSM 16094 TaxID=1123237 RepID=S9Q824_9RHOB|nr:TetR/AcrR family transcriptional regulator [Salipiger mucosus]EPX76142.1 Transcriptional regulator, TetR family [Salipiger mucosus DSM 16094]